MNKNSRAQIDAVRRYEDRVYKKYSFRLRVEDDANIIKYLESKPSVNSAVVEILRKELNK